MAITMAKALGVTRGRITVGGNAGGAGGGLWSAGRMEVYVFMPRDTPQINQYECMAAGARTFVANGLINDCGRIVREGKDRMGWFDLSTLKEPYRIEGKKTMGLDGGATRLAVAGCHFYPTGGGTGLIGMWKAFQELAAIGWLKENRFPRMVAVQSTGCSPIVNAFRQGSRFAELHQRGGHGRQRHSCSGRSRRLHDPRRGP